MLLIIWFEFLRKKQPKQVDLSEVLDFKSISESYNQKGELPPGVVPVNCGFDRPIFRLESRPGIYFSLLNSMSSEIGKKIVFFFFSFLDELFKKMQGSTLFPAH